MIGMVNVQCDTPLDYYATAPFTLSRECSEKRKRCDSESSTRRNSARRTPSWRPLFSGQLKRKTSRPKYLQDGRKASETGDEPNKLWEELFLRSFAQKIEQEIASPTPLEAHKNLDTELGKLGIQDKSFYRSTYSLVSPTRVENTDFEVLDPTKDEDEEDFGNNRKNVRSNSSVERPSCNLFLPFIKSIKGNKKKSSLTKF